MHRCLVAHFNLQESAHPPPEMRVPATILRGHNKKSLQPASSMTRGPFRLLTAYHGQNKAPTDRCFSRKRINGRRQLAHRPLTHRIWERPSRQERSMAGAAHKTAHHDALTIAFVVRILVIGITAGDIERMGRGCADAIFY